MNLNLTEKDLERIFYQRINFNRDTNFLVNILYGLVKLFKTLITKKTNPVVHNKRILFLITTYNQREVLSNLMQEFHNKSELINSTAIELPLKSNKWFSFLKIKSLKIKKFKSKLLFLKKNPHCIRDLYYVLFAEAIVSNIILFIKKGEFSNLIYASDHGLICSLFIVASRFVEINSIYIQHGMVTNKFPGLESTYYFSYGKYSSNKYRNLKDTKIIEVGRNYSIENANSIEKNRTKKNNKLIGISINKIDSTEKLLEAVSKLEVVFKNHEIIIRLHPSMSENNYNMLNIHKGSLMEYFNDIDFHLSSESSIHLDSIYFNTPTHYLDLVNSSKYYDYYGFIKSGLIKNIFESSNPLEQNNSTIAEEYIKNIKTKVEPNKVIKKYIDV